jgi:hypothetical protein
MTPVGHSLMGAAIAALCLPSSLPRTSRVIGFLSFIVLASLPDAPLPSWGHDRYHVSHSLFINGACIALLMLGSRAWPQGRARVGGWRVIVGAVGAWLSHLLLDTFYNHGRGLAMFWPVSQTRLALPMPWFNTLNGSPPLLGRHIAYVFGVELLAYGTLLVLALAWRYRLVKSHLL